MIRLVTGNPGAGKSLYSMTEVIEHLAAGRTVATNIEIVWEKLADLAVRLYGVELDPDQLHRFDPESNTDWHASIPWGTPDAPVQVYLDEQHLFANARDWAETAKTQRSLLGFLTQHRKAHMDITFVTQEASNLDKQYRVLAEWEYFCVSTDHLVFGFLGKLPFKAYVVIVRDARTGKLNKRIWRSYDKRFFGTYKSYAFLNREMAALAEGATRAPLRKLRRVPIWKRLWCSLRSQLPKFSKT